MLIAVVWFDWGCGTISWEWDEEKGVMDMRDRILCGEGLGWVGGGGGGLG